MNMVINRLSNLNESENENRRDPKGLLGALTGDIHMKFVVGCDYLTGKSTDQDFQKAKAFFEQAAADGHVGALFNLGGMYYRGEGVSQDYKKAANYYRAAAEKGDMNAQFNLGLMYDYGEGVGQNSEEANKWHSLAAEQGHAVFSHPRMSMSGRRLLQQNQKDQEGSVGGSSVKNSPINCSSFCFARCISSATWLLVFSCAFQIDGEQPCHLIDARNRGIEL